MRVWQNFGVAKATTNGSCRSSACLIDVRRSSVSGGRLVVISSAGASSSDGLRDGNALVADRRRAGLGLHDDVADSLDRVAAHGFRQQPVRARLGDVEVRDVDVLAVADVLERRRARSEGCLVEPTRQPEAGGRPLDRPGLLREHEERDPEWPRGVVARAQHEPDVFAGTLLPEGLKRPGLRRARALRRGRCVVGAATDRAQRENECEKGGRAHATRVAGVLTRNRRRNRASRTCQ